MGQHRFVSGSLVEYRADFSTVGFFCERIR